MTGEVERKPSLRSNLSRPLLRRSPANNGPKPNHVFADNFTKAAGSGTTLTIPFASLTGAVIGDLIIFSCSSGWATTITGGVSSLSLLIETGPNRSQIFTARLTGADITILNGSSQTTLINCAVSVWHNAAIHGTPYSVQRTSSNNLVLDTQNIQNSNAVGVAVSCRATAITSATTFTTTRIRNSGRSIDSQEFKTPGATGQLTYVGTIGTHVGAIIELKHFAQP